MNNYVLAKGSGKWITVFFLLLVVSPSALLAQSMSSPEEVARIVALENVNVKDGEVSGEVHNLSPNALRDVQLFIRYTWLWDNEFKPGSNDPGYSTVYTLEKEIPAGGRLPFTFSPSPPLPKRSGGRFVTSVSVAGFTEVIPQKR